MGCAYGGGGVSVLALYLPAGLRRRGIHSRKKKSHSPEGPHVQRWGVTRWGGRVTKWPCRGPSSCAPPAGRGLGRHRGAPRCPAAAPAPPAAPGGACAGRGCRSAPRPTSRGTAGRRAALSLTVPPSPLSTVTKRAMAGRGGPHRAPLLLPLLRGPEQLLLQRGVVQLQQAGEAQALQCVLVAWGQRLSITPWRWKGAIWGF